MNWIWIVVSVLMIVLLLVVRKARRVQLERNKVKIAKQAVIQDKRKRIAKRNLKNKQYAINHSGNPS